ncbi:MAG: ABC transporter ATP-binding protein, partial [Rhodobacteraceae bacterium]|nr:ABC transporter ATP-binding protein [Paracoccaceae bacterium]
VGEILRFPLDAQGRGNAGTRAARVREVLDLVNLPVHLQHSYPNQLSGGQAQRVAIARALALDPRALVCDEPTSALDVSVQAHILNLLLDLRDRTGVAIVMISHDMAVVETLADRVSVMYLGRIVEEGPASRIFAQPRHPYTRGLFSSVMAPDADAGLPEPAFHGLAPNPVDVPSGCAFHPRCGLAGKICSEDRPELNHKEEHRAACHFA